MKKKFESDHLLPSPPELPHAYGEAFITTMVRDPGLAYCYWEMTTGDCQKLEKGQTVLRVYDITGLDFDGSNARSWFDIEITPVPESRYVDLPEPGLTICVDIGCRIGLDYFCLARSDVAIMPPGRMSDEKDPRWHVSPDDLEAIHRRVVE